ncbi:hypothetical protein [Sphingobacterium thalpophilum]|uniref:Uncharacterized protein n=1 Tax=Sphingobacterium thalpophilum TaxID=259 RepID=A0A4U9USE4_9SPHI|nr:hypothetical protein [Sphingobacterium thalpophilum]VTR36646.1 Uncharacterised protein [Sphingobacterium thalpophilum]
MKEKKQTLESIKNNPDFFEIKKDNLKKIHGGLAYGTGTEAYTSGDGITDYGDGDA